mmetsp:Transcript_42599/g.100023  ORF Transcript_42599/g.100023 Transcript_42599/m.100023 type:complete len:274 (+) Transcript_42599:669-1490(+)
MLMLTVSMQLSSTAATVISTARPITASIGAVGVSPSPVRKRGAGSGSTCTRRHFCVEASACACELPHACVPAAPSPKSTASAHTVWFPTSSAHGSHRISMCAGFCPWDVEKRMRSPLLRAPSEKPILVRSVSIVREAGMFLEPVKTADMEKPAKVLSDPGYSTDAAKVVSATRRSASTALPTYMARLSCPLYIGSETACAYMDSDGRLLACPVHVHTSPPQDASRTSTMKSTGTCSIPLANVSRISTWCRPVEVVETVTSPVTGFTATPPASE